MLTQIHISNLITIRELTLELHSGTTVITGETGAGKSVLIDAIEIALGNRSGQDVIRSGQEKADISICFDISKMIEARAWLKNYDIDSDAGECIIRRTLNKDGRSKSYINGMPTTLQPLRELSELLINIHGQHEHQALLKSAMQRNMLDRYSGHQHLVDQVHVLAEERQSLAREIFQLKKLTAERSARSEFLKFQLQELEDLHLNPDEFQALDLEHKQLANAEELLQTVASTLHRLSEDEEQNVMRSLNDILQSLENMKRVDPKFSAWAETIKQIHIEVSDVEDELRHYLDTVNLNPERLREIETRITLMFDLARKHKVSPNELFDLQQKFSKEFSELETSDERLSALEKNLSSIEKNYHNAATKLSASRKKFAKKLAKEITDIIQKLALPHGEFHILLEPELNTEFSPHGLEKIIFQIKTNAGQEFQPLAKIASGGELSRISLAIHMATAEQQTIPTLIFDEVDVGIGGGTAEIVGKLLQGLGKTHQVLCITHSPQVAAQGNHHLCAEKLTQQNSVSTSFNYLQGEERVKEIARMLGGVKMTKTTLAHAKEMIGA